MKYYFKTEVLENTGDHYVRLHREAIEIHQHQQSFNKKRRKSKTQGLTSSTEKIQPAKGQRTLPSHKDQGSLHKKDQLKTPINHSDR